MSVELKLPLQLHDGFAMCVFGECLRYLYIWELDKSLNDWTFIKEMIKAFVAFKPSV